MIKGVVFFIAFNMFYVSVLSANFNTLNSSGVPNPTAQKELNSKKDFDQMVKDLYNGANVGDIASLFYLGFIYYDGITLNDGTKIEPKKQEARNFLLKAISLGSKEAAAFLIAKELEEKNIESFTSVIKAVQTSSIAKADKDYFTTILAGYILDYNILDSSAIEVSTKWLYEAEKKNPTPQMQFVLAFLYQKLQNIDAANYYLNKSCSNIEMKDMCEKIKQMEEIQDEQSCQKF